MGSDVGLTSNYAIQLSVWVVTPRACARVAPTHPATDRERWTDKNHPAFLSVNHAR